ncbi:flippase-like domain-containing protein [Halosquirtibacter xylanolyticus]|uniref:lysylphosphatidylglycerol synthase transmembrane domain-containing protein n=1 Tax=Halosquirtibacter xylanolyticus TaxID=3374599 RepID=UPI00374A00AA|nr:flippase-like domain-containing protein [Prolixibacteraceae bacterium]
MVKIFQNKLKYILFLLIGAGIFYYIYRDFDFQLLRNHLSQGFKYQWVLMAMGMIILSHVFRALRWNIVLNNNQRTVSFSNSFLAVMSAYFMNYIVPRMGEVTRCAGISKMEKISFSEALGTVVSERIIDMIMLLSLTVVVILAQTSKIIDFIKEQPKIYDKITMIFLNPMGIVAIIAIVAALGFIAYKVIVSERLKKITMVQSFIQGILAIAKIQKPFQFILYTLAIWFLYFAMDYVCFFAFDFTSHLSVMAGMTVFVFGSYGMVAPVQGGMGPWHFMTVEALALYGVGRQEGLIFALVVHSAITLVTIVVGGITSIIVTFKKPHQLTEA